MDLWDMFVRPFQLIGMIWRLERYCRICGKQLCKADICPVCRKLPLCNLEECDE